MRQSGRKTAAAALAQMQFSGLEVIRRPKPPSELTDEQAEEWRAVVAALPADWFPRETHGLLCQYVRHISRARRLTQLLDDLERSEGFSVKEYTKLLALEEIESRAISSLATRMRMTQQSTYNKQRTKPVQPSQELWEEKQEAA